VGGWCGALRFHVVSDANLNTLVELSDVQFTEVAIGRHYFEEANVGGATN
jgi:hypothetical protein